MGRIKIDIRNYVPALLTSISAIHRSAQAADLRRRFQIGIMEWRAILILSSRPNISGRRLATILGTDTAAISRSLKALEARGFVKVTRDPTHVRRQKIALTREGLQVYDRMAPIAMQRQEHLLEVLTRGERAQLIDLLQRLLDHAPQLEKAPSAGKPNRRKHEAN
ncbi:MarR family winged helix-turn-helix transcriptional regulator [Bradyrhizobium sp. TM239]|uniref:MarR family winged helix-turn-helix transcriptional regulator n=1 Tax=Bradyrhizobium sp. TM239 TaxID=2599802 RepID=UPI0027D6B8A2|nr:hypothetical protein TM239_02550 [Bradyrhizobium sp. TM239]